MSKTQTCNQVFNSSQWTLVYKFWSWKIHEKVSNIAGLVTAISRSVESFVKTSKMLRFLSCSVILFAICQAETVNWKTMKVRIRNYELILYPIPYQAFLTILAQKNKGLESPSSSKKVSSLWSPKVELLRGNEEKRRPLPKSLSQHSDWKSSQHRR